MTDAECVAFLQWAAPRLHLRWRGFRKVRRLPCKRIGRRLRELGIADLAAYRAFVETHRAEWLVLDAICRIPISRFYRDRGVFEALGNSVLPELARRARERGASAVRCWSAGCASGEEVYTLGIVWRIVVAPSFPNLRIRILGTDVDSHLIERARRGCYPPGTLKDLPGAWRERCFDHGEEWCVGQPFREGIDFSVEDVRLLMPEGAFDLVLCRNIVFTYFDEALQRQLGARIAERLVGGGALVIGRHETLPAELLDPWYPHLGIYRKAERLPE